jgi:hypothetical protein
MSSVCAVRTSQGAEQSRQVPCYMKPSIVLKASFISLVLVMQSEAQLEQSVWFLCETLSGSHKLRVEFWVGYETYCEQTSFPSRCLLLLQVWALWPVLSPESYFFYLFSVFLHLSCPLVSNLTMSWVML